MQERKSRIQVPFLLLVICDDSWGDPEFSEASYKADAGI